MTSSSENRDSSVMMSSVMPSLIPDPGRHSLLVKASTAIEGRSAKTCSVTASAPACCRRGSAYSWRLTSAVKIIAATRHRLDDLVLVVGDGARTSLMQLASNSSVTMTFCHTAETNSPFEINLLPFSTRCRRMSKDLRRSSP